MKTNSYILLSLILLARIGWSMAPINISLEQLQPGLRAQWVQVKPSFKGVSAESKSYRGLWTLKDVEAINTQPSQVLRSAATVVNQIDFSDKLYDVLWSPIYGKSKLVPLFDYDGDFQDVYPDRRVNTFNLKNLIAAHFKGIELNQNDFTSVFEGFLYFPSDDVYELSVLNDDGFHLSLSGSYETVSLTDAHLPPLHPRSWFTKSVTVKKGYYRIKLVSFEHLEASVIRMAWLNKNKNHLTPQTIPEGFFFSLKDSYQQ